MSIVSEIERIKSNIANAYTACEEKGATMPSVLNSANLFDCIASITGGAVEKKVLSYYGAGTALSVARRYIAGASIGDYALFGGGVNGSSSSASGSNAVDTYTSALVKGTATTLTHGKRLLKGISTEHHALFGGGATTGSVSTVQTSVDAYDENLVKTTGNLSVARLFWHDSVASVGEYAMFGTGAGASNTTVINVDIFNKDLVLTTLYVDNWIYYSGGASFGEYALFSTYNSVTANVDKVETYDKNLVKGTTSALSGRRVQLMSVGTPKHAIFAGGGASGSISETVDAYDKNLVRETAPALSQKRYIGAAANLGEYAIIAGGGYADAEGSDSSIVDVYDGNLVRTRVHSLQGTRRLLAGATTGKYALFGGGQTGSAVAQKTVDVYELVG